jgi:hypothetical protein
MTDDLHFPANLACLVNNANCGLFHRYVQSTIVLHAALLPSMLEAVDKHDLVLPSARSAAPPQITGIEDGLVAECPI